MKLCVPRQNRLATLLAVALFSVAAVPPISVMGYPTGAPIIDWQALPVGQATGGCAPNAAPARMPEDLKLPADLAWTNPVAEPAIWRDLTVNGGSPLGFCSLRIDGGFNPDLIQEQIAQGFLEDLVLKGWDVRPIAGANGQSVLQALRSNEVLAVAVQSRENPTMSMAGGPTRHGAESRLHYAVNPFVLPTPRPPAPLRLGLVRATVVQWGDEQVPGVAAYSEPTEVTADTELVRAAIAADLANFGWIETTVARQPARPAQVWQLALQRPTGGRLLVTLVGGQFTPTSASPLTSGWSIGYEYIP